MSQHPLTGEISQFFEDYNLAFAGRDGEAIAMFYHVPCVTMRGDGSTHCFQSREQLRAFFQEVSDRYAREGASSAVFYDLTVQSLGGRSLLATLQWQNRRPDGSVTRQWWQSYNIVRNGDRWEMFAATFHID